MGDSPILDVVTGLIFVFAVTAALASVITEAISWFLALRANFLLRGIRSLIDGDDSNNVIDLGRVRESYKNFREALSSTNAETTADTATLTPTNALLGGPILGNLGLLKSVDKIQKNPSGKDLPGASTLRHYPSYFSSRAFSTALLDLIIPNTPASMPGAPASAGNGVPPASTGNATTISEIRSTLETIENKALKDSLLAILKSTEEDLEKFRQGLEEWYDDHMDRVSGWYKRRITWITVIVGAVLVMGLNINTIAIGRTLYTEADTRTAVTAIVNSKPCEQNDQNCIERLTSEALALAAAGLPVGWRTVPADCPQTKPECSSWWSYNNLPDLQKGPAAVVGDSTALLIGWALTIGALIPGARFWYDLLARIGGLKKGSPSYAGPKPPQTPGTH